MRNRLSPLSRVPGHHERGVYLSIIFVLVACLAALMGANRARQAKHEAEVDELRSSLAIERATLREISGAYVDALTALGYDTSTEKDAKMIEHIQQRATEVQQVKDVYLKREQVDEIYILSLEKRLSRYEPVHDMELMDYQIRHPHEELPAAQ